MNAKQKGFLLTAATAAVGLIAALWVIKWGGENDIPVLEDIEDMIS